MIMSMFCSHGNITGKIVLFMVMFPPGTFLYYLVVQSRTSQRNNTDITPTRRVCASYFPIIPVIRPRTSIVNPAENQIFCEAAINVIYAVFNSSVNGQG